MGAKIVAPYDELFHERIIAEDQLNVGCKKRGIDLVRAGKARQEEAAPAVANVAARAARRFGCTEQGQCRRR
jgi:hypothetical protein